MVLARFVSTEGPYLQAQIEVGDLHLCVMDEFSVVSERAPKPGAEIQFEFSPFLDEDESWDSIFSGNPTDKFGIEQVDGWKYRAFGRILSINPVVVDCGLFKVEDAIRSNDPKIIGEFVAFTITRLGGYVHAT